MVGVGLFFSKKIKSVEDYYIGGRSLGLFVIISTVCASILGGSAMIGRGGIMYTHGISGIFLGLPYLIGMYVFSFMSGRIQTVGRLNNISSIPDLMEYRFGKRVRYLVAFLIAFSMMATVASQITAFATILSIIGGISFNIGVWVSLAIIVLYTAASGFYGVAYTDVIQFIVLLLTIYLLLPLKGLIAVGGFSNLFLSVSPELLKINVTPKIWGFIFTNLIFTFAGAEMWQRAFSAKDAITAKRGMFIGNTIYAFTIFITLIISLSCVVLYPNIINDFGTADAVVPHMALNLLPHGALGLAIAGLIAVIMSTADTYLLISVQTLVGDIIKPCVKDLTEHRELFISKIFTVIMGIGAVIISLYVKGVYNVLMFAWTFYAASVGIPAVATLYWKKATKEGVCSGVITGFTISVGWRLLNSPFGLSESIVGSILCLVTTVGVSLATYSKSPSELPVLDTKIKDDILVD